MLLGTFPPIAAAVAWRVFVLPHVTAVSVSLQLPVVEFQSLTRGNLTGLCFFFFFFKCDAGGF